MTCVLFICVSCLNISISGTGLIYHLRSFDEMSYWVDAVRLGDFIKIYLTWSHETLYT